MAAMKVIRYPDPRLREISSPVKAFDDSLRQLAGDLGAAMRAVRGAGLSAVQVGRPARLFVLDPWVAGGAAGGTCLVFVNPVVEAVTDVQLVDHEGCLSFPGVFVPVRRAARALVKAQDVSGRAFELEADGMFARALLHEADHLDGRLLVDHLGPVARKMLEKKMLKLARAKKALEDDEGRRKSR
jgi:peptide deformylase